MDNRDAENRVCTRWITVIVIVKSIIIYNKIAATVILIAKIIIYVMLAINSVQLVIQYCWKLTVVHFHICEKRQHMRAIYFAHWHRRMPTEKGFQLVKYMGVGNIYWGWCMVSNTSIYVVYMGCVYLTELLKKSERVTVLLQQTTGKHRVSHPGPYW